MNRRRLIVLPLRLAVVVALLLSAAACGSEGDDGENGGSDLQLSDVWTRPTAPGAESTAFYVTIRNGTDLEDRVVGARSPRCAMAELHLSSTTDGVMSMSPARPDELTVAADGELTLEPGGLHIMCMGLTDAVVAGDEVELTIEFERAGPVDATATADSR